LGTGTSYGVPMLGCSCYTCTSTDPRDKRLRSSALIESVNTTIIIDTGPDLRTQLLRQQTKQIDGIILTHEHNDHTAGLDDIRPYNFILKDDIPLYAEARVLDNLKERYQYIFNKTYSTAAKLAPIEIKPNSVFQLGDIEILPLRILHGKLPILGYRIGDVAYLTDLKSLSDETFNLLKGIKTLIVTALEVKLHPTHFNVDEAQELAQALNVKETYLIHMSHKMGRHEERQKTLSPNVHLAYDTLVIQG